MNNSNNFQKNAIDPQLFIVNILNGNMKELYIRYGLSRSN